jgi:outer membrane protein assembly factor BamB
VDSTPAAWKLRLTELLNKPMISFGSYSLYPTDGILHTLYAENGSERWAYRTDEVIGMSSAAYIEFSPGRLFFGSEDGVVYCLNASDGTSLWNYTTGDVVNGSPAVADGRIYIGSFDDHVYCLNASTGAQLWNYTTGDDVLSTPAVVDGRVYIGSDDYHVYCLNASTGAQLWNYTTGSYVGSSPAVANGRVYVGSYDANVYCLNASTGTLIWSYPTGNYVVSSPAVTDTYLFIGSRNGKVYCLNTSDGSHIWNYTTAGMVFSSPAIANGIVYIGSNDGSVYAFGMLASLYEVAPDGYQFDVEVVSNSRLSAFTFDQPSKTLSFNLTGDPGTTGVCAVTFPTFLLGGPYVCQLDGALITPEIITNATHTTLAFNYPHSTRTLEVIGTTVIPEYPSLLAALLPLLVLAVTLSRALDKVRRPREIDP